MGQPADKIMNHYCSENQSSGNQPIGQPPHHQRLEERKLRLGKLSYLNNAPIYFGLASRYPALAERCTIVEAPPSCLNRSIRQGEIDLTVVSSIEYARNFEHYLILPDLSISSDGPVYSVLLMSRVAMEELHRRPILLSSESEASVALLKIILSQRGIEPVYVQGKVPDEEEKGAEQEGRGTLWSQFEFSAFLAIGDQALKWWSSSRERLSFPFLYDLGAEWKKMTGLPFVFALWIVRNEVFYHNPQLVLQIRQALLDCRHWSLNHLDQFMASISLPAELSICRSYIQNLDYEFSSRYQQGLLRYYHYLHELGEIPQPIPRLNLLPD
ncbi:MAG: menaquinone biosynthesis protein [bacterium]|nr:menaquinone biosynthesis protein [bacterium]